MEQRNNKQDRIIFEVEELLNKMSNQVNFLIRKEITMNQLDLDLLMENTRKLYDRLCSVELGADADTDFDADIDSDSDTDSDFDTDTDTDTDFENADSDLIEDGDDEKKVIIISEEEEKLIFGDNDEDEEMVIIEEDDDDDADMVWDFTKDDDNDSDSDSDNDTDSDDDTDTDTDTDTDSDFDSDSDSDSDSDLNIDEEDDEDESEEDEMIIEEEVEDEDLSTDSLTDTDIDIDIDTDSDIDSEKEEDSGIRAYKVVRENVHTLGDVLEKAEDNSLAARLQRKPVSDLIAAIGINDKFLFLNELFNGSMEKYNKSIRSLNSFSTLLGAKTYMSELQIEFQWDCDSDAYKKLNDLVERRFL